MKNMIKRLGLCVVLFVALACPAFASCPSGWTCDVWLGETPCVSCGDCGLSGDVLKRELRTGPGVNCTSVGQGIQAALQAAFPSCDNVVEWEMVGQNQDLGCTVINTMVCCASGFVSSFEGTRENFVVGSITVTDVNQGEELAAAEAAYNNFKASMDYPAAFPSTVRVDGISGFDYIVGMGTDETKSVVTVNAWRRGGYKPAAGVAPLEQIQGSGNLTTGNIETAVGGALESKGAGSTGTETAMKNALEYANGEGWLGSGGGGTGFFGTADGPAVKTMLKETFGNEDSGSHANTAGTTNVSDGTSAMGTDGLEAPEKDSIPDKIADFLSDNPVMHMFTESEVSASGSVCSFSGDVYGKEITVSFCDLEGVLGTFGSLFLVVGTLYSMLIVFGRA